MKRLLVMLLWLPLLAWGQGATPMADDPVANKRAVLLAEQLRCLVCQNQSIADSNAELAVDLRRQIRSQIAEGRSDDEITRFMVERYGDFVLYNPPMKLVTLFLWFGPLLLMLGGLFLLLCHLRARQVQAPPSPLSEEQRKQAAALLAGRQERP